MNMDDIKLFAKNEKELETLTHAVKIYSQGIGIEFLKQQKTPDGRNGTTKSRQN